MARGFASAGMRWISVRLAVFWAIEKTTRESSPGCWRRGRDRRGDGDLGGGVFVGGKVRSDGLNRKVCVDQETLRGFG